jgi:choline transporter-like protein 2/4/5
MFFPSVYWSCQYIARASNASLNKWLAMGGAKIEENMLIDKTIHKAIDARSAVLKVYKFPSTGLSFLVCYLIY